MIGKIKHKGLQRFYERGDKRGINSNWVTRVGDILAALDASEEPGDMALPGFNLHQLRGSYRGYYAVSVTGNWRIIFRFEDGQPTDVDLVDYH